MKKIIGCLLATSMLAGVSTPSFAGHVVVQHPAPASAAPHRQAAQANGRYAPYYYDDGYVSNGLATVSLLIGVAAAIAAKQ